MNFKQVQRNIIQFPSCTSKNKFHIPVIFYNTVKRKRLTCPSLDIKICNIICSRERICIISSYIFYSICLNNVKTLMQTVYINFIFIHKSPSV